MAGKIFINYRRDDSASHALNVAQYLEARFGKASVFIDVDRLRAGQKFPVVLEQKLTACRVMLAVIGPQWLTLADAETGRPRIADPEDWVRLEIERALARGVHVIPVLVAGATLPKKSELPASLAGLLEHQTATITTNGFRAEMAGLAADVAALIGGRRRWPWAAAGLSAVAALTGLLMVAPVDGWMSGQTLAPHPAAETKQPADAAKAEADRRAEIERTQKVALLAEQEARVAAEARKTVLLDRPPPPGAPSGPSCFSIETVVAGARKCLYHGEVFRDCPACPEMVVVPAGSFMMGSPASEEGRDDDEGPQRTVTISKPFAVGKYEVTFAEWYACVTAGGCQRKPGTSWGRGRQPVINVFWDDAKAYAAWLSQATGQTYQLLSEAEWEYAARAGTTTPFAFGATISTDQANYDGNSTYGSGKKGQSGEKTVEVGSFPANTFGLHDLHGNVWEWVEDCWIDSYRNAPPDGTARTTACTDDGRRVVRGGSWYDDPVDLRSAGRSSITTDDRISFVGFRVGRTLSP